MKNHDAVSTMSSSKNNSESCEDCLYGWRN